MASLTENVFCRVVVSSLRRHRSFFFFFLDFRLFIVYPFVMVGGKLCGHKRVQYPDLAA